MFVIIFSDDKDDKEFYKMLKGFDLKFTSDYDNDSYYYYFETINEHEIELINMILNHCDIDYLKIKV